jgi:hypothetical protein
MNFSNMQRPNSDNIARGKVSFFSLSRDKWVSTMQAIRLRGEWAPAWPVPIC